MKKLAFIAAIIGLTITASFTAFGGEWINDSKGWWYQQEDRRYPANTWQEIDHNWYYFDQNGYMKTGWMQCDGNWYYCNLNGKLAVNQWIPLNGVWYYLRDNGMMVSDSWYNVDGQSYYFGADGAMQENAAALDGNGTETADGFDSTSQLINYAEVLDGTFMENNESYQWWKSNKNNLDNANMDLDWVIFSIDQDDQEFWFDIGKGKWVKSGTHGSVVIWQDNNHARLIDDFGSEWNLVVQDNNTLEIDGTVYIRDDDARI